MDDEVAFALRQADLLATQASVYAQFVLPGEADMHSDVRFLERQARDLRAYRCYSCISGASRRSVACQCASESRRIFEALFSAGDLVRKVYPLASDASLPACLSSGCVKDPDTLAGVHAIVERTRAQRASVPLNETEASDVRLVVDHLGKTNARVKALLGQESGNEISVETQVKLRDLVYEEGLVKAALSARRRKSAADQRAERDAERRAATKRRSQEIPARSVHRAPGKGKVLACSSVACGARKATSSGVGAPSSRR